MFEFLNPLYLLLLIPILIIILVLYFIGAKNIIIWDVNILKKVFKNNSLYFKLYIVLIWMFLIFAVIIFSNPVLKNSIEKQKQNGIDIQIVLDVSYSMIAEDLKPNRLEVAKDVIKWFLWKIETDRVWIIVFAWKTFTSIPLSFDYEIIKNVISNINIDIINQNNRNMQGTAVWDALLHAGDSFKDDDRKKVIILLTDGEANKWLDPLVSINYLQKEIDKDIKIYTIWIWSDNETSIFLRDNFWRKLEMKISWVDEVSLKTISEMTNWKYFRAKDKKTFESIFDEISKIEKTEIEIDKIQINKTFYSIFIYIMIMVFVWFIFLKNKKNI